MNRDVTYKDSLLFHISTMKILCPVFGIIMLVLGFIEAKDGYYVITGLGVIGLLLMIYITLKVNKKKTFSYMMTEDDITFKEGNNEKKYAYEDITKLVDDGKTLTIYSKEGVIAQLSSLEFEVADLAELVEECTDHKIPYEDIEGSKEAPSRMPSVSVTKPVMLVLTLIQLVSLVAGMIGALDSLVVSGLISVVVPVLAGIYYLGLTAEGNQPAIKELYGLFFCNFIIPTITGWLVLFTKYAMENTRPLIYASIIVFLIIFVFYRWIGEKAGLPRDALFTCFLVIFIPLALCWINDPLAKVTNTEECIITKTEHYTTKFSQVYHFNVKTGKKKFTYRATAKEFKQYKKGDTITITTKTGPFAVSYKEIKK